MLNRQEAQAIITKLASYTNHYAVANISNQSQGTTRFANSEISQNIIITDTSISLTVYTGKKEATCATNVLTDEGLQQLVKDAEAMLEHVPDGEFEAFYLPQGSIKEKEYTGTLAKEFDITARAEYVKEGMSHVLSGFTAAGALDLSKHAVAVGDNRGVFNYAAYDELNFNTVVTHQDGTAGAGECQSYTNTPDIIGEFKKAQSTAKAAMGAVSPELGAHTVVLSPVAFADLVYFTGYMLGAGAVDTGVSFAVGKLGQQLFGSNFTMIDDVNCPETRPHFFDYEGSPRQAVSLVKKGVISSFMYDNKLAARHNTKNTGHAISNKGRGGYGVNLQVLGGNQSLEEIIASTDKGIFINQFHYTNVVNPRTLQLTGLTRNGSFMIENGKLTTPISTVRFTQSLLDAFSSITALSKERTLAGDVLVPAARIEGFHFTSKP